MINEDNEMMMNKEEINGEEMINHYDETMIPFREKKMMKLTTRTSHHSNKGNTLKFSLLVLNISPHVLKFSSSTHKITRDDTTKP